MNLRLVRRVATAVLLLDVVALGAAAVEVNAVSSSTTTTPPASSQLAASPEVPGALPTDVADAAPDTGVPIAAGPVLDATGSTTRAGGGPGTPGGPGTAGHPAPSAGGKTPTTSPAGQGGRTEASRAIPRCPIKLTPTTASGGLQSLVPFAPAFGPYSGEAFALASAYQPELQLLGPILAQYPRLEPTVTPLLNPLLTSLGSLLQLGYDGSAPLYGPYRTQFLEAETKLAAALAPYSRSLAYSELGGCIVQLESALVAAGQDGGSTGTASPSLLSLGGLL